MRFKVGKFGRKHTCFIQQHSRNLAACFNPYRAVQLVQPLVHPHLDAQPLPDERHLVRAVLGRQELLALLLLGRRST